MKLPFLAALALGSSAALLSGQAVAQNRDAPVEAVEPVKEKKVCRTYKVTGSLTRRTRICRTAAEWDQADEATYKGVSDMQNSASGGHACTPNPNDPARGCN
jgi:hypothetical protein